LLRKRVNSSFLINIKKSDN